MGQRDIYDWLKTRREILKDDSFFLPKEIEKGMREQGVSSGSRQGVRGDCFRLYQSGNGCIEMKDFDEKGITNWLKAFRYKKSCKTD